MKMAGNKLVSYAHGNDLVQAKQSLVETTKGWANGTHVAVLLSDKLLRILPFIIHIFLQSAGKVSMKAYNPKLFVFDQCAW